MLTSPFLVACLCSVGHVPRFLSGLTNVSGSCSICSCILLPIFPFVVEVGQGRTSAISRQKTLVCGRQVSDMSRWRQLSYQKTVVYVEIRYLKVLVH